MLLNLVLLFTMLPLVELALLIWIGSKTSVLFTIGLVLATGVIGASLARWQGWRVVERIQSELRAGRMPADAMVDGLLILVAGALLITPGVLTDAAGFMLLVPPLRRLVKRRVAVWLRRQIHIETVSFRTSHGFRPNGGDVMDVPSDRIIDAEVLESTVDDAR